MVHARRLLHLTWLLPLLLVLLAVWGIRSGWIAIPEEWNPWAPLRIEATPNLLTRFKLSRASADPVACRAALAQATLRHGPMPDRSTGPGCGFANAVRIERTSVAVGAPFPLSWRAASSLAMWERHVLQDAASTHLGSRVVSIRHLGSYACRNLYGEATRRRSQHATALDIAGFVLADGRRVSVVGDWQQRARATAANAVDASSSPEARFLSALHDGACRYF